MHTYPLITVVGGSGFVGRHLIKQLAAAGYRIRVLCRDAVAAQFLTTAGNVGQIVPMYADITRPETLTGKFDGSFAVINLVSILYQSGRQKFDRINIDGARTVAEHARAAGAERFIQISALGVAQSDSTYARTKLEGEAAVRAAFPGATIFRPSLIIGPEDGFFQKFGRMMLLSPFLPLIGGGRTKFQPVLVQDVAGAITAALKNPATAGQTYTLAGPEVMSMHQMLQALVTISRRPTRLVDIPFPLASLLGLTCELMPIAPAITRDQVKSLKHDNIAQPGDQGFEDLGITPGSVTAALPSLLTRYIKG